MYNNDGILIKGNKDGINTTIHMNKFACFEDMLQMLIKKLSKGKHFYKGTTLILRIDLKSINKKEVEILKETLLTEIEIKDIVLEDIEKEIEQVNEKETKNIFRCI